MSEFTPIAVTAEEAVARLINLNYLPSTHSLFDMTSAFVDEAEVAYENAIASRSSENDIDGLKFRMEACRHRHQLATILHESIRRELKKNNGKIKRANHSSSIVDHLDWGSIQEWVDDQYGISVFEFRHEGVFQYEAAKHSVAVIKREGTGLSRKVADSLYLAFYCLVEMYAKKSGPALNIGKNGVNVAKAAEEIFKHAARENKSTAVEGLSTETIKTRIEEAKKVKLHTLSGK